MPLRSRLRNTGLKLKIPVRNVASSSSPYGPSRHSASPIRRQDENNLKQQHLHGSFSLNGLSSTNQRDQRQTNIVNMNGINNSSQTVTSFDASIDARPVWAVKEDKAKTSTEGFRNIPITKTTNMCGIGCDNGDSKNSNTYFYQNSDPETPELEMLASPDFFTNRSPLANDLQRINQRAEHLRDWFHDLSPKIPRVVNPFFGTHVKKEISYSHCSRYLSSPVPTFRSRSDISPSR